MLEVRGLGAGYGPLGVLHGLDFSVARQGITVLLGANGAGKTTTLRALCAMLPRVTGTVTLQGERIDRCSTDAIARKGVAHVPEDRGTFSHLSVQENLRVSAWRRRDHDGVEADLQRVRGYFPRLAERWARQAGTLSGGEQQMLAVSRALMTRPRLLLLDEPSCGLSPHMVGEVFAILERLRADEHVSMLMVEQNAGLALDFADEAVVLRAGRVVLSGPADEVRRDDAVRRAYLGR